MEILTVMAIIGILAGVATPMFLSWLPDIRLKSAARDLFSQMQTTRMLAVKENRNWAIVFDTANRRYYICNDWGADATWTSAADLTGTGDNTIVETVDLATYRHGIGYGNGAATLSATTPPGALPADSVGYLNKAVVFTPRGTTDSTEFVYLAHQANTTTYAVGSLTSGSIRLRRWLGGADPWQ